MPYGISEPIFTHVLDSVDDLRPAAGSLFITGKSVEERSEHFERWEATCPDVMFAKIVRQDRTAIEINLSGESSEVGLRSTSALSEFFASADHSIIYLDITGLAHHVWAPLLRVLRQSGVPARAVYVEPGDYRYSPSPTEGSIFDLSERIQGIAPLPGFASLARAPDESTVFVPLLGFEGARFAHVLEAVQPDRPHIYPIVGVPGFRPEYPFHTYLGNRSVLSESKSWQNIRYVPANCAFSTYQTLEEIARRNVGRTIQVAPIGTKPHALGSVLFALDHPDRMEIVYDHPVRKEKRTSGFSRVCVYDLSLLPTLRVDRRNENPELSSNARREG